MTRNRFPSWRPSATSIRAIPPLPTLEESDLIAFKPNIDVIVHGKAWASRGKPGRFFDLNLNVAGAQRALRVFGDRRVRLKTFGFEFTDPEPIESMP